MNIEPTLCNAIRDTLASCGSRPLLPSALLVYARPQVIFPVLLGDIQGHLLHLEERGEVQRHANRDNAEILSWSLTEAGRARTRP